MPKYQHIVAEYSTDALPSSGARDRTTAIADVTHESDILLTLDPMVEDLEDDPTMDEAVVSIPQLKANDYVAKGGIPITMQELADTARQRFLDTSAGNEEVHPDQNSMLTSTPSKPLNGKESRGKSELRAKPTTRAQGSAKKKRTREESEQSSPATKRVKVAKTPTPVTAPTRVLRPRPSKSATQLEEERERERAYRNAVVD